MPQNDLFSVYGKYGKSAEDTNVKVIFFWKVRKAAAAAKILDFAEAAVEAKFFTYAAAAAALSFYGGAKVFFSAKPLSLDFVPKVKTLGKKIVSKLGFPNKVF